MFIQRKQLYSRLKFTCAVALACFQLSQNGMAANAKIEINQSTLAVVTQKEGIASGLAHRHIVIAYKWSGNISVNRNSGTHQIESGTASITIPATDLHIDNPENVKSLIKIKKSNEIWNPAIDKISPENASKVRENMIDKSQLAVTTFPTIEGQGSFNSCQKISEKNSTCDLTLTLKIRDQSITKKIPISIEQTGSELTAEFLGRFQFSDFGIKPFTAMLGAIAVSNEFALTGRILATESQN